MAMSVLMAVTVAMMMVIAPQSHALTMFTTNPATAIGMASPK